MNFDQTSAVPVHDNVINTTSFDINSAKDEPQLQNATPSANPVSGFVGFLRNIFGNSPVEEMNRTANLYANSDKLPSPVPGETIENYTKRANASDVVKNYEGPILQQGVMRQLQGPMDLAVGASALEAPAMTAAVVGGFSVIDKFFNARDILNKYAPNTPPELKDAAEIVSMLAIGGGIAHGVGFGKSYLSEKLNSLNIPDATHIEPEQLRALNDNVDLTIVDKKDILDKLGISQSHVEASISTELPIKVPITNLVDLVNEPYWNKAKESFSGIPQQFEDAQSPRTLDYLAQYLPAKAVASLSGEDRLSLANGPWQDLRDLSIKYDTGELPAKPLVLNDKSNIEIPQDRLIRDAFIRRGSRNIPDVKNMQSHPLQGEKPIVRIKKLSGATNFSSTKEIFPKEVNKPQEAINEETKNNGKEVLKETASQSQPIQGEASAEGSQTPSETTSASDIKTSGLSSSVEQSAIKEGLTKDLGDLPSYQKRDMGEIATKVSEFINNDHELAKRIALGEAPEQDGLRSQELYTGLRIKAEAEGDVNTLRDLALSDKAATMATELGQRVKALDAGTEDSPIEAIKQVKRAREDAVLKKSKSKNIDSAKKDIIKEIKNEVKKNVPTKETWTSFVESIQC